MVVIFEKMLGDFFRGGKTALFGKKSLGLKPRISNFSKCSKLHQIPATYALITVFTTVNALLHSHESDIDPDLDFRPKKGGASSKMGAI
jgi:hypothetical protein